MTKLKDETYEIYKKTRFLKSKLFKEKIVFNRYGWIHLSFTSGGHKRPSKDRNLRLHLFKYASDIVKEAGVIIKETEGTVLSKRQVQRKVKFYEIANECDGGKKHITVILRKIEDGNLHFYSLRRTSSKIKKALEKGYFDVLAFPA